MQSFLANERPPWVKTDTCERPLRVESGHSEPPRPMSATRPVSAVWRGEPSSRKPPFAHLRATASIGAITDWPLLASAMAAPNGQKWVVRRRSAFRRPAYKPAARLLVLRKIAGVDSPAVHQRINSESARRYLFLQCQSDRFSRSEPLH